MQYWLLKSEPETYSWENLEAEKNAVWDGVRNYQARNYLQQMQFGDLALFYHSGKQKQVVGICRITKEHYPEPGQKNPTWVAVETAPVGVLKHPVSLSTIKNTPQLEHILLVRQSRLSVMPLTEPEFSTIVQLGNPTTP